MTKKRVIAYYDGSNFYHHSLQNYGIKDINFFGMTNQVLSLSTEQLVKIKYFNCPVSQQEDPQVYAGQQKFLGNIRSTPLTELLLGRLVKRKLKKININCPVCNHQRCDCLKCPKCKRDIDIKDCFKFLEKGVDVKLAINLLLDAVNDKYDVALLFSSDSDYVPAIKYVIKHLNKEVVYCHFPYPKTSELIQNCSGKRLITQEMVKNAQLNH